VDRPPTVPCEVSPRSTGRSAGRHRPGPGEVPAPLAAAGFDPGLSDDQLADYGPWFDSHRRLRELVAELEELSLAIAEADPRWNR